MCIGDWRLGRLIRSQGRKVTVANGTFLTLPNSPQRVGLYVSFDSLASVVDVAATFGTVAVPVQNWTIGPANWLITMKDYGDLPTRPFTFVSSVAAAGTIGVVEWFLPENVIQSCLEAWQRENIQCLP